MNKKSMQLDKEGYIKLIKSKIKMYIYKSAYEHVDKKYKGQDKIINKILALENTIINIIKGFKNLIYTGFILVYGQVINMIIYVYNHYITIKNIIIEKILLIQNKIVSILNIEINGEMYINILWYGLWLIVYIILIIGIILLITVLLKLTLIGIKMIKNLSEIKNELKFELSEKISLKEEESKELKVVEPYPYGKINELYSRNNSITNSKVKK